MMDQGAHEHLLSERLRQSGEIRPLSEPREAGRLGCAVLLDYRDPHRPSTHGRSRSFVLATVLVLGLGLGANVILFNAAYALLWRPLNFFQPDRSVTLSSQDKKGSISSPTPITGTQAAVLADQVGSLAEIGLAASAPRIAIFQDNETLDLAAARVNSGGLRALARFHLRPARAVHRGDAEAQPRPATRMPCRSYRPRRAAETYDHHRGRRALRAGAGRPGR